MGSVLWNGLRTCVRASKLLYRILKFINHANLFKINEKCYRPADFDSVCFIWSWCGLQIVKVCFFSVISWPILILFVLSDRAWCGLQNFYTEFWNSLCKFMQIYSNSMKNDFSVISWPILILFVLSDRAWCGLQNFYTDRILKFINHANLCKFIQNH